MRERAPRLVLLCLHWGTERRVRVDALSAFTAHPDEFDLPLGHSLRYSHSRGRHCVQCRRMNVASCNDAGRPTNHPRPRCFAYLAHMNFSAQDTRSAGIDPLEKKDATRHRSASGGKKSQPRALTGWRTVGCRISRRAGEGFLRLALASSCRLPFSHSSLSCKTPLFRSSSLSCRRQASLSRVSATTGKSWSEEEGNDRWAKERYDACRAFVGHFVGVCATKAQDGQQPNENKKRERDALLRDGTRRCATVRLGSATTAALLTSTYVTLTSRQLN